MFRIRNKTKIGSLEGIEIWFFAEKLSTAYEVYYKILDHH